MNFMKKYLTIIHTILLTISLFGCYTPNKSQKALNKAYKRYPSEVATFTREKIPCIVTDADTVYQYDTSYDFIEVLCPDQEDKVKDTTYLTKNVKYVLQQSKYKIIAMPQKTKTITITQKIEDSAKILIMATDNKNCADKVQKLSNKIIRKNAWIISFLILLLISLFFNFLQFTGRSFLGLFSTLK